MTRSGEVKLTDFGIAAISNATRITVDGWGPMTTAYTAPERIRGETGTAASDIFSLGVTLYEAVEGISPFQREETLATMYAVLDEQPPRPQHAPPLLAETLRLMLRKDPATRAPARQVRAGLAEICCTAHQRGDTTER
ncbi:protein kinase domain-containing protein [Candidatus Protofrankia californiensis]|uniref:protein kinase domain-containing protein n=1 Tax=Candidatus Protofrankia californiensis TaxID=1839754 RepID=UPI0010419C56|nr:protein kinase [Candidatus Protofrankia californiensis]